MQIKPAGIDDLGALVHIVNALLEHAPPITRNIFESLADQRIKSLEGILNPPSDKNQEHG
jgi:hypothetical protein